MQQLGRGDSKRCPPRPTTTLRTGIASNVYGKTVRPGREHSCPHPTLQQAGIKQFPKARTLQPVIREHGSRPLPASQRSGTLQVPSASLQKAPGGVGELGQEKELTNLSSKNFSCDYS